jgi:flavorubredoxin
MKALKTAVEIIAAVVLIVAIFVGLTVFDASGYTATNSQTLSVTGQQVGKVLVVYDPGLSTSATKFANKVAFDLQALNYSVILAGVKSSEAQNAQGYDIIVVGGPIYMGGITSSVKYVLDNLHSDKGTVVGVFGSGMYASSPEDLAKMKSSDPILESGGSLSKAIVIKIGNSEDINATALSFVNQLLAA